MKRDKASRRHQVNQKVNQKVNQNQGPQITGLALTLMMLGINLGTQSAIARPPSIQPPSTQALTPELQAQSDVSSELKSGLEAELATLGEALEKNLQVRIDTEAIEQAARPVLRESLQTILEVAPALSRQAVTLGEWYLGQLGERALEELENAQETLEELEEKL